MPRPGALSTRMPPPCPRTMPSVAASPSPRPVNFVVKNGSKIRARVSSSMPTPSSATSSQTIGPLRVSGVTAAPDQSSAAASRTAPRTRSVPAPSGIASVPLISRFMITCCSCERSPITGRSEGARSSSRRTFLGADALTSCQVSPMSAAIGTRSRTSAPRPA